VFSHAERVATFDSLINRANQIAALAEQLKHSDDDLAFSALTVCRRAIENDLIRVEILFEAGCEPLPVSPPPPPPPASSPTRRRRSRVF
jgi:hypothetical protein